MSKQKSHYLVVKVSFDKPCTRQLAIREARDTIHGTFYTTQLEDSEPGSFDVKSFKLVPRKPRR